MKYSYWYRKYCISSDEMYYIFGVQKDIYLFLAECYKQGQTLIDYIEADAYATEEIRNKFHAYKIKDKIWIADEYIACNRQEIIQKLLKVFFSEKCVPVGEFFVFYTSFIEKNVIEHKNLYFNNLESVSGVVGRVQNIVWRQNKMVRFYDYDLYNFKEFTEALDLFQYVDVEISSEKLFIENYKLMKAYNIYDSYELHNILKRTEYKWNPAKKIKIDFGRMPSIGFGNFNRKKQVVSMIQKFSPINGIDLAKKIHREYGFGVPSVMSNWIPLVNEYCYNNIYLFVEKTTDKIEDWETFRDLLQEDFYLIEDFKIIFEACFPNDDFNQIPLFFYKTIGFIRYSGCIIRNKFSSAREFFRYFLQKTM